MKFIYTIMFHNKSSIVVAFWFSFLTIILRSLHVNAQVPVTDSLALVALYNSTNGVNWIDKTNWLSGPVSTWDRVQVQDGRVTTLYLASNQLSGSIPATIGNLTALQNLNLAGNELSGNIPEELGNVLTLQVIHLYDNQLSGSIPASLGNIIGLQDLWLSSNQLSGVVPEALANIPDLQYFYVNNNQLTSLPVFTANTILNVSNNQLTFESLEANITKFNFIGGYAPQDSIGIGANLLLNVEQTLALTVEADGENNQYQWTKNGVDITGATSANFSIDNVTMADAGVYGCKVTNTVVSDLTLFRRQANVSIQENRTVPESDSLALVALYNSTNGSGWATKTNWLTGNVDTWYGITVEEGRVTGIDLGSTTLIGSIPVTLGNLSKLTQLNLEGNQLSGTIPISVGNLSNLTQLNLAGNQLVGTIPESLGNLTKLTSLYLWINQLSGTIPASLGNLSNLNQLYLAQNELNGTIPASLSNLSKLTQLNLAQNLLGGVIPASLGNLSMLSLLNLSSNYLNGTIPTSLGNLTNLTLLNLSDNQLSGAIPVTLGNLSKLTQLNLGVNQLSGVIPTSLGNLSTLTHLFLGSNQLNGTIPASLGNLTGLEWLSLGANQLSGISESLGNLSNLSMLDLSENQISGTVPESLGNLTKLTSLYLRQNQLSGQVPASIGKLTNLKALYLSDNRLTSLPSFTASFSDFQVANNQLGFESLEPNISIFTAASQYAPQDSIGLAANFSLSAGQTLKLTVTAGGENNEYQWTKDGVDIIGATSANFSIGSVTTADGGVYSCKITNTLVPDLTLYRRGVNVKVSTSPQSTTFVINPANGGTLIGSILYLKTVPSASTYTVEVSTASDFTTGVITKTTASRMSTGTYYAAFPELMTGQTYYARVKTNLSTDWGRTTSFTTATAVQSAFVSNPSNGGTLTGVNLYLNTVPGAASYTVQVSTASDFTTGMITKTTASRLSTGTYYAAFPELMTGQTYYARVKTNLSTDWGRTTSFTTATAVQSAFVSNPSNGGTLTGVNLYLNTVPGAASYTVQVSTASDFTTGMITKTTASRLSTGTYYAAFPELMTGQTYYARVKTNLSTDWGRTTSFNKTVVGLATARVGVNSDQEINSVSIVQLYPNPFAEQIQLEVKAPEVLPVRITIMDMQGKVYFESGQYSTNQPIQLGYDLKPGVYMLKVTHPEFTQMYRIIKL